jgi:transcriptional regulator with XRE-family HTH domain
MSLNTQAIPPNILAIWTRTLRLASNLSQDALAEASGLSERTIQRVETVGRANQMTRRSIARGFGYDNLDIFDDPTFITTAIDALAEIHAERAKNSEANHPDHIRLAVEPVSSGSQIASLIDRCDAWVFDCADTASAGGKGLAAILFDNVQDYGDIWQAQYPSARLEAREAFTGMLTDIARERLCVCLAIRPGHLGPVATGQAPVPFNTGYLIVVPAAQALSHILVPKRV